MPKNPPPVMIPLSPLPVALDDVVDADLELSLSTPSTLVVNARLEVETPDASGPRSLELALVIPRSKCRGERPRLGALLEAARAAVARATRAGTCPLSLLPRRVVAYASGRPHLIPVFD
ncbi:hypothetical protein [Pelomonas cellulosilytica]|uniref:Ribosome-binding factor A n=1 Tax=Pelomonas cellulosilytica TaxID=2906762 RepID=A0ABS8XY81_9BURK|nr:hypothetical protein [Pelomonas sp. P8]MCE4557604.1 hypothetical protein [Pelomonas sp. P8]